MNIKFSIIVSCYNQQDIILKTLDTIKNQSYKNFECIIVDDCSIDASCEVVQNYIKNDSRFTLVKNTKNSSLYMVRKVGVSHASGDYILFLDGDDYFIANSFEILNKYLQKFQNDVVEFGYKDNNNNKRLPRLIKNKSRFDSYITNMLPPTIWNKAYKTEFLKNIFEKMPDMYINMAEDVIISTIVAYHTNTYSVIKKPFVIYNVGSGISTKMQTFENNKHFYDSILLVENTLKTYFENKLPNYLQICENIKIHYLRDLIYNINYRTKKEDVISSLLFLINSLTQKELEKLYSSLFLCSNSIENVIKCFGRKRLLLEILKYKK